MKKILVTGSGGYIGRHVVKVLLDRGEKVTAVDLNIGEIDARAERIQADILAAGSDIYRDLGSPDICMHMAWKDGFIHNSDSHIEDLFSHYSFIRIMLNSGLRQIAVMGTMHEIGYWEGEVNECTPTNPRSLYGIAKNSLRQMTELLVKDFDATFQWLRAYYIVGDDLKNNSIFTKIIKMEQQSEATFPFNSGKNQYDFMAVQELAEQIASVITQKQIDGIINCCKGKPVALAEKVEEFLAQGNFKIRPEYFAFKDRPYDSPAIWGNAEKINQILHIGR